MTAMNESIMKTDRRGRMRYTPETKTFLLHLQIRLDVEMRGNWLLMTEPQGNDFKRDAGL